MVDWNNSATVTTPPSNVLKQLILEKREYVIEAIQRFLVEFYKGGNPKTNYVRTGVFCLLQEIKAMLKNSITKNEKVYLAGNLINFTKIELDDMYNVINNLSSDFQEIITVLDFVDDFLYTKGLIKIDFRDQIDTTSVEAVNQASGLY